MENKKRILITELNENKVIDPKAYSILLLIEGFNPKSILNFCSTSKMR